MKKKCTFLLISILISGIAYSQTSPDRMSIEIIPDDYTQTSEITIFAEDWRPYTNSTPVWTSVASEFSGFQFFSTDANNVYEGKIVPSATGVIYLVGTGAAVLDGWTKTDYTADYESASVKATTVYVFQKTVNLGDTISLPTNKYWTGFSPLAYSITIKDPMSGINNPVSETKDYLKLTGNTLKVSEQIEQPFGIYIYDVRGKLVLQKNLISSNETIPIGFLSKGIYLAKINMIKSSVSQKLLIK